MKKILITGALAALFVTFYFIQAANDVSRRANNFPISSEQPITSKSDSVVIYHNSPHTSAGLDGDAVEVQADSLHLETQTEIAASNSKPQTLNDLVTVNEGKRVLETETLEKLTVSEIHQQVDQLASLDMKSANAKSVRRRLSLMMSDKGQVYRNALQCSDTLCAMLISDLSRERVSTALDDLTRDKALAGKTSGGYLRIIKQNETYYGLFVTAIDDGSAFGIR